MSLDGARDDGSDSGRGAAPEVFADAPRGVALCLSAACVLVTRSYLWTGAVVGSGRRFERSEVCERSFRFGMHATQNVLIFDGISVSFQQQHGLWLIIDPDAGSSIPISQHVIIRHSCRS